MPLDPRIPMGFRSPEFANPLDMALKGGKLAALMQGQQANELTMRKAQQDMEREALFQQQRQALGPNPDPSRLAQLAAQFASPKDVLTQLTASEDRRAQREVTREATQGRLALQLQGLQREQKNDDFMHEWRTSKLSDDRERAAETNRYRIASEERKRAADETNAELRRMSINLQGMVAGLRQPPTVQSAEGIFERGPKGLIPLRHPETGKPLTPTGVGNIELRSNQIDARQIGGEFDKETKIERNTLAAANGYANARSTGDNGQAAAWAATTIQRAIGTGSQRFKGDAEKLLGGGYGGGALHERLANFLSTETTGTPTAKTMAKLDALVNAAENAAVENFSERTKFYANRARGKRLSLRDTLGAPNVFGRTVVYPDGTREQFKDALTAQRAASTWKEGGTENPVSTLTAEEQAELEALRKRFSK